METKTFSIENLINDNACKPGLEYARTLITRNLPAFETCMQEKAFGYARWLMRNGYVEANDITRDAVNNSPACSYCYARYVDRGPHDVTREGVKSDRYYSYLYALNVDRGPRDDTREAVKRSPVYRHLYALNVDKVETRQV